MATISPYSALEQLVPIDRARAGDELARIDEMRRAPRMQNRLRIRQCLHERAGAAGVIEVHVSEQQQVDRATGDAEPIQRREQIGNRMRGADIDERRAPAVLDEVRGREPRPHVLGIDGVDAVRVSGDRRLGHRECEAPAFVGLRVSGTIAKCEPDILHGAIGRCIRRHRRAPLPSS